MFSFVILLILLNIYYNIYYYRILFKNRKLNKELLYKLKILKIYIII